MAIPPLVLRIYADSSGVQKGVAQANAQVNGLRASVQKNASLIKTGLVVGAVAGLAAATKAASDLGEQQNRANVVFGESVGVVNTFAAAASRSAGLSKTAALEGASSFGAMFDSAGLAEEASAQLSVTVAQLAGDMASFNNQDPSEMLDRLRAGLSGEAEPLRRFGIFLSEARVQTEAYKSGLADVGTELTDAQKIQARFNIIMQDSAKQQGDFARTLGESLPNQIRQAKAELTNFAASIGKILLPVLLKMVKGVNSIPKPMLEAGVAITAFATAVWGLSKAMAAVQTVAAGGLIQKIVAVFATGGASAGAFALTLGELAVNAPMAAAGLADLWDSVTAGAGGPTQQALTYEVNQAKELMKQYGALRGLSTDAAFGLRTLADAHQFQVDALRDGTNSQEIYNDNLVNTRAGLAQVNKALQQAGVNYTVTLEDLLRLADGQKVAGLSANRMADATTAAGRASSRAGKRFKEWAASIKESSHDAIVSLGGVEIASGKTAREFFRDSAKMLQAARQSAKGIRELARADWVPEAYKKWLVDQGPGAVSNFASLSKQRQREVGEEWQKTQGLAEDYGKTVSNMNPVVKTDTSSAQNSLQKVASLVDYLKQNSQINIHTTYSSSGPPPVHRQHGGHVTARRPYIVGERGPELFVPSGGGTIVPNGRGRGSGPRYLDRRHYVEQADYESSFRGF